MNRCPQDGCTGHLGKFDSCLSEAVWQLSLEGMWGESTGSTEFESHLSLMIFDAPETVTLDGGPTVTIPAGNYISESTEQGFVYLLEFDTEEEAREVFDAADARYGEWIGDD